ncbi:MAG TPA: acyl transferase [Bacteroidia bacterium]|jgi:hypothetical protein|nr:acyl transferase [Bacteroidia bacterium]
MGNYTNSKLKSDIFSPLLEKDFERIALEVYHLQYEGNKVYNTYASAMGKTPANVKQLGDIPFLPVSFFKTHDIVCGAKNEGGKIFTSSSTTSDVPSRHIVNDITIYEKSFRKSFEYFYGDIKEWCILALLPSYLERSGSSLVYMAEDMVKHCANKHSGFFLNNMEDLRDKLLMLEKEGQKTLLLGVTFALLNFSENYPLKLKHTTILETGGMKGKRQEIPRKEVHQQLINAFGVSSIHSEYGMTELLSQAYSKGKGIFYAPSQMRIMVRDIYDPLQTGVRGQTGAINIIDLANMNSCSFIATDDVGIVHEDGSFEISGRLDQSDIRGCNLMAEEL